jgi:hypothetical protein
MKDKDGNEIPGSEPTPGQDDPNKTAEQKLAEMQAQMADLIAANKKRDADYEIQREENQRLTQMLKSVNDHPGDDSRDTRRPPAKTGRFSSEFERKYSIPVEAAEEIAEEAVSRMSQAQQEREEAIRNAESIKASFFDKYPDLKDYIPVVRHFSDKCAGEHPDWTVARGFPEVARLSREYIKSKLSGPSGRDEPPPVLGPGGHRDGAAGGDRLPGSDAPTRMPTQDEEIRAEMEERNKNRSRAL